MILSLLSTHYFYRFTPDGTALQSVYEAFRFTESYGVKSFYIIIVKIVSTAKILDYCHISDISYTLCDKCYDWPWSFSHSIWKQSNQVKYLMISNLTCNNFDPLGDIPVQCQVLPRSLWTGNFHSVFIYIYHLQIFLASTFLCHFDLVKVMFKQMSLLFFISLIKHSRKKIILTPLIKHTRAAGGACSVVRKNIIFSHFQNICSTFTHFQSDLAFALSKFQYLRYSWNQRLGIVC